MKGMMLIDIIVSETEIREAKPHFKFSQSLLFHCGPNYQYNCTTQRDRFNKAKALKDDTIM